MRFKLLLDEETENELLMRSYYLGVSLTAGSLLHLVLYNDLAKASREDVKRFLSGDHRVLQMDITDHVLKKYDSKVRFNYSLSSLLSVQLMKITKETKSSWVHFRCDAKEEMTFSTYSIEDNVIKRMNHLKQLTGLTITTIVNFAALVDIEKEQLTLFDESESRKRQGFQISSKRLQEIRGQASMQKISIGNLLEIKLKKTLKRLAK